MPRKKAENIKEIPEDNLEGKELEKAAEEESLETEKEVPRKVEKTREEKLGELRQA